MPQSHCAGKRPGAPMAKSYALILCSAYLPLFVLCFSRAQSVTGRIMLQPIRPMVACKLVRIPIKHKYYAPLTATCSTIERTAACQRNEALWQRSVSKDKTALRFRIFCHLRIGPTHITLFGDVIVQHGKRICRKRIRMFVRKADKISFFAATGQSFRSFAELPMAEIMDVGSSMRKPFCKPFRAGAAHHFFPCRVRPVNSPTIVGHSRAKICGRNRNHKPKRD